MRKVGLMLTLAHTLIVVFFLAAAGKGFDERGLTAFGAFFVFAITFPFIAGIKWSWDYAVNNEVADLRLSLGVLSVSILFISSTLLQRVGIDPHGEFMAASLILSSLLFYVLALIALTSEEERVGFTVRNFVPPWPIFFALLFLYSDVAATDFFASLDRTLAGPLVYLAFPLGIYVVYRRLSRIVALKPKIVAKV